MRVSINPVVSSFGKPEADVLSPAKADVQAGRRPRTLLVFRADADGAAEILRGIAHHQQAHGGSCALTDDRCWTAEESDAHLDLDWDGVITRAPSAALVAACAERGLLLVDVDEAPSTVGVSKVRTDQVAIGAMGAEFLLERGFRSFAFVGRESPDWARERQAGFVEAIRLGGQEAEVFTLGATGGRTANWSAGEARTLGCWLRGLPKPAGVMACDDQYGVQVLEAARGGGCLVPEEIAVLGADNDMVRCELATPTLSSVDPGLFQVGYRAAEHLGQRLAGPGVATCDLRLDPAGIVARRSTDVLAIPDHAVAVAARYIAAHACEGLTVADVLPQAGVSRSQLEKKFRQHLGRSPQAEIRRVQVARIRQLLAETDLPLKVIASQAGFAYMEYMCVVFRRLTGETPGAYRRRCFRGRSGGDHRGEIPGRAASIRT